LPRTTYHVQSFERVSCWIIVSNQCRRSFETCSVKLRTSISHQRHHLFPCLAIGVRCPGGDLRCTSSSHLPLCQVCSRVKRLTDRSSRRIQGAVDIAKESFGELKDVERERISFEVKVNLPKTKESRTAVIGRTAWPIVVASLAQFEIVEIRVAPETAAVALSSSQASATEPPPYAPAKSGYSDSQTNGAPHGPQITSSQSPSPPSLVTRIVNLFRLLEIAFSLSYSSAESIIGLQVSSFKLQGPLHQCMLHIPLPVRE
jgi:hypothetical protein